MALFSTIGSVISSKSQNKAIGRAAETSEKNNTENTQLARDIYGQNRQILSPFVQRGNVAGDQMNALLGLGGAQMSAGGPATMQITPNADAQFQGGSGNPLTQIGSAMFGLGGGQPAGAAYGLGDNGAMPYARPEGGNALMAGMAPQGMATPQGAPQQTPQQAANNAFDIFKNSTGYQFRLGEGLDAVGSAYAGIGGLQSGAARRGINEYGQNFASNEFGNYLNALSGQQAVGAGAASSLAGVGQNFAGTVIGANNFNAQNQMNAQLGKQNPWANGLGTFGAAQQQLVGTVLGERFGG